MQIKINLFDNISVELPERYEKEMYLDKITGADRINIIKKLIAARYRVTPGDVEIN
jgi:hypothetical protein